MSDVDRSFKYVLGSPMPMFPEDDEPTPKQWAALASGRRETCRICGAPVQIVVEHLTDSHPDLWHLSAGCSKQCYFHTGSGFCVDRETWARPAAERWTVLNPGMYGPEGMHPPGTWGHPDQLPQRVGIKGDD